MRDRVERHRALVGVAAKSLADDSDDVTISQYQALVLLEGRVCDVLVDKKLIRRRAVKANRRGVCAREAHAVTAAAAPVGARR